MGTVIELIEVNYSALLAEAYNLHIAIERILWSITLNLASFQILNEEALEIRHAPFGSLPQKLSFLKMIYFIPYGRIISL